MDLRGGELKKRAPNPTPSSILESHFRDNYQDFHSNSWNEICQNAIEKRCQAFTFFRSNNLFNLKNFREDMRKFLMSVSEEEKKEHQIYKDKNKIPSNNLSSKNFLLSEFEKIFIKPNQIEISLGKESIINVYVKSNFFYNKVLAGIVDRNQILSEDVKKFRQCSFELGGKASKITHLPGNAILIMKISERLFILIDGQR